MTIVSVMDRDGWCHRTDNLVVVDPSQQTLSWVPRDLWCPPLGDRINTAFQRGGHPLLLSAMSHFGFGARRSICLQPIALRPLVDQCSIEVPVERRMEFFYPLRRDLPIEDGRKKIAFTPPAERLTGERIHQWVGARKSADGHSYSDLDRIRRQQTLIRCLLESQFDFAALDPIGVSVSSEDSPYQDLTLIDARWHFRTFGEGRLCNGSIDGKCVLLLKQAKSPCEGTLRPFP